MNVVRRATGIMQEFSLPLLAGVIAGLAVANIDHNFYEELVDYNVFGEGAALFGHTLEVQFLINEVFMVFFFGIASKEIAMSALPGGALNPLSKAVNPLLGTLGGVLGPAGLYFLLVFLFYGGSDDFSEVANGWGIPTATDIAVAWLVARTVFGAGHPAVNFLLLLAVADDAIGLGIIAVFYPDPELPVEPIWLLLTGGGMVLAFAMRRRRVNSWVPYVAIAGTLSWFGFLKASIAPALTLVTIVPFLPGPKSIGEGPVELPHSEDETHSPALGTELRGHSPLEQFEHHLKLFVDMGLFFFAFANAGAPFGAMNGVTAAVLLSLIVGKMVGISLFSAVAMRAGFPLPTGMGMRHLAVAGLIAGLGLTVALFVAGRAFAGSAFEDPAKMGAVLSAGVALLAYVAGTALGVKGDAGASRREP